MRENIKDIRPEDEQKKKIREILINILDDAIVPYINWRNRDTPSSQEWCAKKRMYLKAWCDFRIIRSYDDNVWVPFDEAEEYIAKQEWTMYLDIFHYEFEDEWNRDSWYFPSPKQLAYCKRNWDIDWY